MDGSFLMSITHSLEYRKYLSQFRGGTMFFKMGYQEVSFPAPPGRYDDQLIELARIIWGEIENPYPLAHDLLAQECVLTACGYPVD